MSPSPQPDAPDRLLVQIASYNTNLQGFVGLPQDLVDWLSPTLQVSGFLTKQDRAPDIVAVGFQELLPLHLGLAGRSQAVIDAKDKHIRSQIEQYAPNKKTYSLVAKVVNVGVGLLVYAQDGGVGRKICDVQTQWIGCGPAYMGNKGAVGVRFRVAGDEGQSGEIFTFACAHLAAHAFNLDRRIDDYHNIVRCLVFPPPSSAQTHSPTTIYSTSHLFFLGDLNFRIALPESHPLSGATTQPEFAAALGTEDTREAMKEFDQLLVERRKGTVFVGLREGAFWKFKCSYKYYLGEVDKYSDKRTPSWTDRIMYATYTDSPDNPEESGITNLLYTSVPSYTTSDHKPIVALLLLPPSSSTTVTAPPSLCLPPDYNPKPDPRANLKRYIGRAFDRVVGYTWWIFVVFGAGSSVVGIFNFFLGLCAWRWWGSSPPLRTIV